MLASPAAALVFASPATEPQDEAPPDFPYWDYVVQRRYEGPTVIYLGAGFAMTARHVGKGEILLEDRIFEPRRGSNRTILNANGTAADAMIFEIEDDPALPSWPLIPIATEPPRVGEEVLLVGFGRQRARVVEFDSETGPRFSFKWTEKGAKGWATNRITSAFEVSQQENLTTRAFMLRFDEPGTPEETPHEAQAAHGDSGGGVFVERDGEWQLLGLMISVSSDIRAPLRGAVYGDVTLAIDLSYYRDEVLRWTRTACGNERDDDGDDLVDYPDDPGCDSPLDRNERDGSAYRDPSFWIACGASFAALVVGVFAWNRLRRPAD